MKPAHPIEPQTVRVACAQGVRQAVHAVRTMAATLGFPAKDCAELEIVTSELATNLVQHASGGLIQLSPVQASGRDGIRVTAEDHGPGITDPEQAVTDGFSTRGGLGIGLGTVNRLMDEMELHSNADSGLRIVCDRWLRPPRDRVFERNIAFGVATRACRLQSVNGDTFVIKEWNGHALASLIDGLGHGVFAQRAAYAARNYVEAHYDQPLDALFRGTERACRATRGVVMAVARFDTAAGTLTVANVGNVEVRVIGPDKQSMPRVRRGILGLNAPAPWPVQCGWDERSVLVMHSDGISSHWNAERFPGLLREAPTTAASHLLQELGKTDDDATVIVVRHALS
ncbi:MAG TPA: ATP-binding SpoIIE family protein phosphatase [Verrucomicrobiae bacterium]|nr:ATP-binding SpoIIE family protein phosphatase [Verrucomicrobiae bacterium]